MTVSRREVGFNERDLLIAIGEGADMTGEEIADFAGVNRSTVYSRKATNKDFIETWAAKTKLALAAKIASVVERQKAAYQRMYDKAILNLEDFLTDDDAKLRFAATVRVIDQTEGKPVQRVKAEIDSTHTETRIVQIDTASLQALVGAVHRTAGLLLPAPATAIPATSEEGAIDAELVGEPAELANLVEPASG